MDHHCGCNGEEQVRINVPFTCYFDFTYNFDQVCIFFGVFVCLIRPTILYRRDPSVQKNAHHRCCRRRLHSDENDTLAAAMESKRYVLTYHLYVTLILHIILIRSTKPSVQKNAHHYCCRESEKETSSKAEEDERTQLFFQDLRRLQNRCKCTEAMCADIVTTFGKYMGIKPDVSFKYGAKKLDKKLQAEAGIECLQLHGCPACHKFVYMPSDKRTTCPFVKKDGATCGHSRFDENNKPREVRFLFV